MYKFITRSFFTFIVLFFIVNRIFSQTFERSIIVQNAYGYDLKGSKIKINRTNGNLVMLSLTSSNVPKLSLYNNQLNQIWSATIGSSGLTPIDLCLDNNGDIYVIGAFFNPVTIGTGTNQVSLSATTDVTFIAKFDVSNSGSLVWVRTVASTGGQFFGVLAEAIVADDNFCYITGEYEGTATFGTLPSITSLGAFDTYVAKFDLNGNAIWAKNIAFGSSRSWSHGIDCDNSGNVFLIGNFESTATFNTSTSTIVLTVSQDFEAYVAKFNSSGVTQWAKQSFSQGGIDFFPPSTGGNDVAYDPVGDYLYITGFTQATDVAFGPSLPHIGNLYQEPYLVKLNVSNGSFLFASSANGSDYASSETVCIDIDGNPIISGGFLGTQEFSPTIILTGSSSFGSLFISKFDPSGTALCATFSSTQNSGSCSGNDLDIDATGKIFSIGVINHDNFLGYDFLNVSSPGLVLSKLWNYCCTSEKLIENTTYTSVSTMPVSNRIVAGFNAAGNGTGNVIVSSGSFETYVAGDHIQLVPGFHAEYNSKFHSFIGDCLAYTDHARPIESSANNFQQSHHLYINNSFEPIKPRNVNNRSDENNSRVVIYPNPNNGIFSLISNSSDPFSISIFNSVGQNYYFNQINRERKEINLTELPKGIYFLKIECQNKNIKSEYHKIVLQ